MLIVSYYRLSNIYDKPEKKLTSSQKTIAVVGDLACGIDESKKAASSFSNECQSEKVLQAIANTKPDEVLLAGDIQYFKGATSDFEAMFLAQWKKTGLHGYAVPGNHEYGTPRAADYFSSLKNSSIIVGEENKGFYSVKLGDWTVYALNSNCEYVGGCGVDSEQYKWLKSELAITNSSCTLAMWHHPLFTSGRYAPDSGSRSRMKEIWKLLEQYGTDLVVSGHDHIYERFAGLTSEGILQGDAPRQFVVGTGGRSLYTQSSTKTFGSEFITSTYGFLQLKLAKNSYGWRFIDSNGQAIDEGRQGCN